MLMAQNAQPIRAEDEADSGPLIQDRSIRPATAL
jgi:hypothetical protein